MKRRRAQLGFTENYVCPVVAAFEAGRAKKGASRSHAGPSGPTFSTDGRRLYSYRTVIARREDSGRVVLLAPGWQQYSVTTARQLRETLRCLRRPPICFKAIIGDGPAGDVVDCYSQRPKRRKPSTAKQRLAPPDLLGRARRRRR